MRNLNGQGGIVIPAVTGGKMKEGKMKEKMKEELDDFRNWNSLVELLSERVKELEDNIPDPEWCCEKHKATLVARIKKLEEGIGKVLQWRNFDGDGISDPLRQELYKLVEKEKP